MKNIIAISGSLRKDSYNTMCLKEIEKLINAKAEYKILDISKIPLFNEDLERDNFPESVKNLNTTLFEANLIIISTPEYNYSLSGVLKNALDWFSRGDNPAFLDKKVAIISASMSRFGGIRAQGHLRQILLGMGANIISHPEIFISSAHNLFTNNNLDDERTIKTLKEFTEIILKNIN